MVLTAGRRRAAERSLDAKDAVTASVGNPPSGWMRTAAAIAVVAVLYYFSARLGLVLDYKESHSSPVWPASGLALAVLFMVVAINEMAHIMGAKTVAEYAHSAQVVEVLGEIGVDYAQGFYLGRPRPLDGELAGRPGLMAPI
jgi:hypothetical protein